MKNFLLTTFLCFCSVAFAQITHTVQPKETIYGISKQYNLSQEEIINANPEIETTGLQIGMELTIPNDDDNNSNNYQNNQDFKQIKSDADFYYLSIQPKQTLYSISKEYNVSIDTLKKYNPSLEDGLQINETIRIPKSDSAPLGNNTLVDLPNQNQPAANQPKKNWNDFIEHKIKASDNIYSIMVQYNVSLDDLLQNNPSLLQTGLVVGKKLSVPVGINPTKLAKYKDGVINLALLLPFYLNDDSKKDVRNVALDFLTGANIALDSLAQKGKNIKLKVVDTQNQSAKIKEFASQNNQHIDAVIGPLYGDRITELASYYQEDYLPIFSPKNNDKELENYKNVYIANTNDKDLANEIIDEMKEFYAGEQIFILTDNDDEELAKYTKQQIELQLNNAKALLTKNVNDLVQPSETISETLEDGSKFEQQYFTPIITILVSNNNNLGESYFKKISSMNPDNLRAYGVKYVSSYAIKKQQNIKKLLNIGFAYTTDKLANVYGKKEKRLMSKFKKTCCANPNQYQQIGFDLVYDVVDRMNESGLLVTDSKEKTTRFSSSFEYRKTEKGAYQNRGVKLVKFYKKDTEPTETAN